MIEREEAGEILRLKEQWVEAESVKWRKYRAAWSDEFYEGYGWSPMGGPSKESDLAPIKIAINDIRPWAHSFEDSLFYKGLHTSVEPDDVLLDGEQRVDPKDTLAIRMVLDRILATRNVEARADQAYQMGLMYGAAAFKVGRHPSPKPKKGARKRTALDLLWVMAIPPWEAIWDPRADPDSQRYTGHVYYLPEEQARAQLKIPDESEPTFLPDTVGTGWKGGNTETHRGSNYFRIFELYDLTGEFEGEPGRRITYLVDGSELEEIRNDPMPYTADDGSPLPEIVPIVMESMPEFPLWPIAPVAAVYELSAERNLIATFLANAYRRDAARKGFYDEEEIDKEKLEKLLSGADAEYIGVSKEALRAGAVKWAEMPPTSDSMRQYALFLQSGRQDAQQLADFTRGKPGEYLTATEVQALTVYSETTIGHIRKRFDTALAKTCDVSLRVLQAGMEAGKEKSIRLVIEDQEYTVDSALLERRWKIGIVDTATTPMAEAAHRAEITQALPLIVPIIDMLEVQIPGFKTAWSRRMYDHIVDVWNLPRDLSHQSVAADVASQPKLAPPVEDVLGPDAAAPQGEIPVAGNVSGVAPPLPAM